MDNKLALKLNKHIIESAKRYAKNKKISLLKMIETYLKSIKKESKEKVEITPFVESLSGVINLDNDYKKDYSDYLNEK
ncbi:MAG: DUF6364 family protein [Bacteroidota bacterium]|nr:DUF6364 family protein [Bacteroidota bacterium]